MDNQPDQQSIDSTLHHVNFLYPLRTVIREPQSAASLASRTGADNSYGGGVPSGGSQPSTRSRSYSNATVETALIRMGMAHSLTDMFDNVGKGKRQVCPSAGLHSSLRTLKLLRQESSSEEDTVRHDTGSKYVSIMDVFEAMRLCGGDGDVEISVPGPSGVPVKKTISRPIPFQRFPELAEVKDCTSHVMFIWALFVDIGQVSWEKWLAATFFEGNPTVDLRLMVNTAMFLVAKDGHFRDNYSVLSNTNLAAWLSEARTPDNWDYSYDAIGDHPFSLLLNNEGLNLVFLLFIPYQFRELIIPFKLHQYRKHLDVTMTDNSKWTVWNLSLLHGVLGNEGKVYPPQSHTVSEHSENALKLLARICGTSDVSQLKTNSLILGIDFLVSPAVEKLVHVAIYTVGYDVFASFVANEVKPDTKSAGVQKSDYWLPLHTISFAASFVSDFSKYLSFRMVLTLFLAPSRADPYRRL